MNVLTNDSGSGPLRIVRVVSLYNPFGAWGLGYYRIGFDGSTILYQPKPNTFGTDVKGVGSQY